MQGVTRTKPMFRREVPKTAALVLAVVAAGVGTHLFNPHAAGPVSGPMVMPQGYAGDPVEIPSGYAAGSPDEDRDQMPAATPDDPSQV